MFFKVFFKSLKILSYSYIAFTGMIFIYSIKHLSVIDSVIVGFIFLIGSIIGICLMKYFGNAIISYKIDSEFILLTNAKQNTIKFKKDNCYKIINKANQIILEFDNQKKHYIHKYYFGNKKFFDFSVFNKSNFKNAEIIGFIYKNEL